MTVAPYLIGYARVSKGDEQSNAAQARSLAAAGCQRVFEEAASGGRWDRPVLHDMLRQLRPGDTVVVWKLDRLTRSLKDLLHLIERIEPPRCGVQVADRSDRHDHGCWPDDDADGRQLRRVRAGDDPRAYQRRPSAGASRRSHRRAAFETHARSAARCRRERRECLKSAAQWPASITSASRRSVGLSPQLDTPLLRLMHLQAQNLNRCRHTQLTGLIGRMCRSSIPSRARRPDEKHRKYSISLSLRVQDIQQVSRELNASQLVLDPRIDHRQRVGADAIVLDQGCSCRNGAAASQMTPCRICDKPGGDHFLDRSGNAVRIDRQVGQPPTRLGEFTVDRQPWCRLIKQAKFVPPFRRPLRFGRPAITDKTAVRNRDRATNRSRSTSGRRAA